jgi:hypothetical protein
MDDEFDTPHLRKYERSEGCELAIGVSSDPRLRDNWLQLLEATHALSLASPSLVEFLTKQDLAESYLWRGLDEIFSGRFADIVQVGYLPFDVHPLAQIIAKRDKDGLRQLRESALRLKIGCEAEFLRFLFMVLLGGFLHVLFENQRRELTSNDQTSLSIHFTALMKSNAQFLAASLTAALMAGYESGNVKKAVDAAFYDQLWSFAYVSLVNLHTVRLGLRLDEVSEASAERQRQIRDAVHADPVLRQIGNNRANPLEFLRQTRYRESVGAYIRKLETDFKRHWMMPSAVLGFFVDRLQTCLFAGAKFRKNDIIDLLLTYSTFPENTVFVSNDDAILDAMAVSYPASHVLSMSLRNTQLGSGLYLCSSVTLLISRLTVE